MLKIEQHPTTCQSISLFTYRYFKNRHYLILAHKFVSKDSIPRYSDRLDVIFKLTRHEDEICPYCNKQIGNEEWQREVIGDSRAVHTKCHNDEVFKVIQE